MLRGFLALTVLFGLAATPVAFAKSCRDTMSGKFTKCEKHKTEKCRDAQGKFMKCKSDMSMKDMQAPATPSTGFPGKN